ncbi:TPA: DUF4150 domain-containing protein [Legionella pneumophila]|nr:DUF4150 domain-containing protein [Legionella pneumophila]HAT2137522.1 DUF4150 domain-containing protein [Legionella pneumophila]HAT2143634.1 DUF4150 domain-containing protein [Legionella pneumophila]HAT2146785.1 DUF4150 domain-containing protein [Legionella pneumophila]HAT2161902.1 DUF4150 domain-containing protein [Legionella pneumophila]
MTMACMLGGWVETIGPTDVCIVPPEFPTPFYNLGSWMYSENAAINVLINSAPSCNTITIIPISTGDEEGRLGGVVSGTVASSITPLNGLFNVTINGFPACNVGITQTYSNFNNTYGVYTIPSQENVTAA